MSSTALTPDACYQAVRARDRRFDGVFYTAVSSTGIYCRPSCPARTPARRNVTFHPTAASAQEAGFRACKRCLPDATPGSPEWDLRADVAGRAMRLIADGVVDREGVEGLAARLGFTARHLNRLLNSQLGAGPLALARARRAQTARSLIASTGLSFADVAFAAGFCSIRQFNDTMLQVYAATPSQLRGRRSVAQEGPLRVRIAVRTPFAGVALSRFLAARAVPGVEEVSGGRYRRTVALPHGPATVELELADQNDGPGSVPATLWLTDLRDTSAALERCRRLIDADCDPVAVAAALQTDPLLAPLIEAHPGLRVPGQVDGFELAIRAVLGQQISVARARGLAGRIAAAYGEPLESELGVDRLFPTPQALAALRPEELPMPRARARALIELSEQVAHGRIRLDQSSERQLVRQALLALPGIGPWTADYIVMRALGEPDILLASDLGTRHACAGLGIDPAEAAVIGARWAPWRSYAQMHLWQSLSGEPATKLQGDK